MTDEEGIGTEGAPGIPVWLALLFAGLMLIGFVIALVSGPPARTTSRRTC